MINCELCPFLDFGGLHSEEFWEEAVDEWFNFLSVSFFAQLCSSFDLVILSIDSFVRAVKLLEARYDWELGVLQTDFRDGHSELDNKVRSTSHLINATVTSVKATTEDFDNFGWTSGQRPFTCSLAICLSQYFHRSVSDSATLCLVTCEMNWAA